MSEPVATTIGQIAAELVRHGLPKYDHSDDTDSWEGPDQCWWIDHQPPAENRPRTFLGVNGVTHGYCWQFTIASCSCCDAVTCVELLDEDGIAFSAMPFWPGLSEAIALHRHLTRLWDAEVERLLAD